MYSSYSYLDENRNGVIVIESEDEWPTTYWTASLYFEVVLTMYSLYPLDKTGNGTLSNNNKTLTIVIPQAPKYVLLTVGDFTKRYSFVDGGLDTSPELVYFPVTDINVLNVIGGYAQLKREAFVLFNDLPNTTKKEGMYKATLMIGKDIVGYAYGVRFLYAINQETYGFGGIIFPKVLFIDKPNFVTDIDFKFVDEGNVYSYTVSFDGERFTGPSSERFVYRPNQIPRFYTERSMAYFQFTV